MRRLVMVLCALSITGLFAPRFPAFGEIMTTLRFEEVPPKRLVDNLQAYIKAHPKDADAYYELGRVYSLLYTVPKKTLSAAFQKLDGKPLEHGRLNAHYDDFGTPLSPDNSRETPPLKAEQEKQDTNKTASNNSVVSSSRTGRPRESAACSRAWGLWLLPPWAPAMRVMVSSINVPPRSLQPQRSASVAPARVSFTQLG
mgnify:CR=1 FL=1